MTIRLRFSKRAAADILEIAEFTLASWGSRQAIRYVERMRECCRRLSDTPGMGRPCGQVLPGLLRFEQGEHVIFYRMRLDGILIARILHRRMQAERQDLAFEDDES